MGAAAALAHGRELMRTRWALPWRGRAAGGCSGAGPMTLAEAELAPGALLCLRWGVEEGPPAPGPCVREDLARTAVPLA